MPLLKTPGMITLGGGMPNPSTFPVTALSFATSSGQQLSLTPAELNEALQYSPTPGLPSLVAELTALQRRTHAPPTKDWGVIVTVGSQDGLCKAFEMLLNPDDSVLVEDPTYPGTLAFLQPFGCTLLPIETDGQGLVPSSLERVLRQPHAKKPRVLYTIPTGQNPNGSTQTLARKQEIYALACQYNLIIMEDDPYCFLNYGAQPMPKADADFRVPVNPSYFSMDTQGRVLRFDSFSKTLSSGLRIGWVTGPNALIRQLELHQQATSLHNSGLSQAVAAKLLTTMGAAGLDQHLARVALFYGRRRDALLAAATRHLTGLATWSTPSAGMFIWFQLHGVTDSMALIKQRAVEAKVLLIPGQSCSPTNSVSNCVRAAFSTASDADMDTALSRLATLLRTK